MAGLALIIRPFPEDHSNIPSKLHLACNPNPSGSPAPTSESKGLSKPSVFITKTLPSYPPPPLRSLSFLDDLHLGISAGQLLLQGGLTLAPCWVLSSVSPVLLLSACFVTHFSAFYFQSVPKLCHWSWFLKEPPTPPSQVVQTMTGLQGRQEAFVCGEQGRC